MAQAASEQSKAMGRREYPVCDAPELGRDAAVPRILVSGGQQHAAGVQHASSALDVAPEPAPIAGIREAFAAVPVPHPLHLLHGTRRALPASH